MICPLSVLYSWCNEVEKHAPSLNYFRFHSSDTAEREVQKNTMVQNILDYDVIITTYEMAKNPAVTHLIRSTYFNLCVLDEGHVIKSLTSQISEAVRKIHAGCRVILTGTPLQNNLVELYAILNFLYPQYFTTPEPLRRRLRHHQQPHRSGDAAQGEQAAEALHDSPPEGRGGKADAPQDRDEDPLPPLLLPGLLVQGLPHERDRVPRQAYRCRGWR